MFIEKESDYKNFWKPRVEGMRVFTPTIQFGQILQALTIMGTMGAAVFTAGQWVSGIRSDLNQVRAAVNEETTARQLAESNLNKSLIAQQEASKAIVSTMITQHEFDIDMRKEHDKVIDTLGRFDRTYQKFFSISQPQPAQRR